MDISLPPEKYSELLILCAHDTHHDFFQPKETFEKIMSGGVGRQNLVLKLPVQRRALVLCIL